MKKVRNYSIQVDRSLCIGAATCVALAPKGFTLDNEAKSTLLDSLDLESDETIIHAAKSCPVGAISVVDTTTGKQIVP